MLLQETKIQRGVLTAVRCARSREGRTQQPGRGLSNVLGRFLFLMFAVFVFLVFVLVRDCQMYWVVALFVVIVVFSGPHLIYWCLFILVFWEGMV
jgi:Flp pilus assembly protein TadB